MKAQTLQKILVSTCIISFSFLYCSLQARKMPDWTFAVYMEAATPDMHYWVHKNMNDMAFADSDAKNLNIVTQVHLEKAEAWRYIIRRNSIKPLETTLLNDDCGQNIVDFMKWTVQNHPAKHYGLIVWGHGFGILDPLYQPTITDQFAWDVKPDEPENECIGGICPLKFFPDLHLQHRTNNSTIYDNIYRGFLFNDTQTFVNNTAMVSTLKAIKDLLKGKNLDIFGTDCCKMAMLEVAYQIKDFTNYLVGSQNCELIDGWNYKDFFSCFKEKPLNPAEVVQSIVKTYNDYYEKNTIQNTYTLSALDLTQLDPLVSNLNTFTALCKKLLSENNTLFKTIILNARTNSPSMCHASYYLDLGEIYANLAKELETPLGLTFNTELINSLKNLLAQGQELIKPVVTAKAGGTAVANLHGISIYFPRNRIDESYLTTPFAQETAWLNFLKEIVSEPLINATPIS